MPVGAAIGIGSVASGFLGARGAKKAAGARVAGINEGVGEQRNTLEAILELFAPGRTAGNQALNTFASAFIPGFQGVAGLDPISAEDLSEQFANLPGTQAGLDLIEKNVGNSFAARGGAFGGNALRALTDRQTNFFADRTFNSLRELMGVGERATFGSAGATESTGANISNLLVGAGEARAGGIEGKYNSFNNAIQGGLNSFLLNKYIDNLPVKGTPGSGPRIFPSDVRLKEDIEHIGMHKGFDIYKWKWNDRARELGVTAPTIGVIAQEVLDTGHVTLRDGYFDVDYAGLFGA